MLLRLSVCCIPTPILLPLLLLLLLLIEFSDDFKVVLFKIKSLGDFFKLFDLFDLFVEVEF
jgi:hypothetical protein